MSRPYLRHLVRHTIETREFRIHTRPRGLVGDRWRRQNHKARRPASRIVVVRPSGWTPRRRCVALFQAGDLSDAQPIVVENSVAVIDPNEVGRSCVRNVPRVTTPNVPPPPPFGAQNKSGSRLGLTIRMRPSAVTSSASSSCDAAVPKPSKTIRNHHFGQGQPLQRSYSRHPGRTASPSSCPRDRPPHQDADRCRPCEQRCQHSPPGEPRAGLIRRIHWWTAPLRASVETLKWLARRGKRLSQEPVNRDERPTVGSLVVQNPWLLTGGGFVREPVHGGAVDD